MSKLPPRSWWFEWRTIRYGGSLMAWFLRFFGVGLYWQRSEHPEARWGVRVGPIRIMWFRPSGVMRGIELAKKYGIDW